MSTPLINTKMESFIQIKSLFHGDLAAGIKVADEKRDSCRSI